MATRLNPNSVGIGTVTTVERDALIAGEGDTTFNVDSQTVQTYDGSRWVDFNGTTGKAIAMTIVFG